jgi:hypothetical protein
VLLVDRLGAYVKERPDLSPAHSRGPSSSYLVGLEEVGRLTQFNHRRQSDAGVGVGSPFD